MLGFWTSGPFSVLGASDRSKQIVVFILLDSPLEVVQCGLFCDRGATLIVWVQVSQIGLLGHRSLGENDFGNLINLLHLPDHSL